MKSRNDGERRHTAGLTRDALLDRIESLQSENERLTGKISILSSSNETLSAQYDRLRDERDQARAELALALSANEAQSIYRKQAEAEREAWKTFALHQQWCQTCADNVADCPEGSAMHAAAEGRQRGL